MPKTGRNFSRGTLRLRQVLFKVTRSSMVRDQERVEACHNSGMDMSLSVMTVMTVKKNPVMKDRSKNLFLC